MPHVLLADATDLTRWADRNDARTHFPQLVRRLVLATTRGERRVTFRSGEGVQLPGWDGIVAVEEGNAFVPAGVSGWELGTGGNIEQKASDEYRKRTARPGELEPAATSFVFVTPRRWRTKGRWAAEKQSEGVWRDVLAYDADDLESCLDQAPAVHLWFSKLLGKLVPGALDLETYWEDWATGTRPRTSPEFVLAGRSAAVGKIGTWLASGGGPLALQGESAEEALAVFAACVMDLHDDDRAAVLANTVLVDTEEAARHLASNEATLTLVMDIDSASAVTHAIRQGHRVVLPTGQEANAGPECVPVGRLSPDLAAGVLVRIGLAEERAHSLASIARRSLSAFRRELAVSPQLHLPEWARSDSGPALLAAMFAGAWNGSLQGDRDALARIGGRTYEEIHSALARWSSDPDPPARRSQEIWYLVSREDCWRLLARYVDADAYRRYRDAVLEILAVPDPRFDLPTDRRYMAHALGDRPGTSPALRRGLAQGLALMASTKAVTPTTVMPATIAACLVEALLERANTDWRIWASLSNWGVLPLLAEAAPDEFLGAVDRGVTGDAPVLRHLFADDRSGLFTSSPHPGLLWALETLAWNEHFLAYVASLLARLARIDPGGSLSNRPHNSLRDIFRPWLPGTAASAEKRLRVLEALSRTAPDVTWDLMVQLLPRPHDSGSPTARPKWRDWAPEPRTPVLNREYWEVVSGLVENLLGEVGQDGGRWSELIAASASLPAELRRRVIDALASMGDSDLPDAPRSTICGALRELVSRHRSYPEANWSLPVEELAQLDEQMRRLEPTDLNLRFAWLFEDRPKLPEGQRANWDEFCAKVRRRQVETVRTILAQGELPAVIALAEHARNPSAVGSALSETETGRACAETLLRELLGSSNPAHAMLARGLARSLADADGRQWVETLLSAPDTWAPLQMAQVLTCLPPDVRTWDLAQSLGTSTEQAYWRSVRPHGMAESDVERAVVSFLEHGRPGEAVDLLSRHIVGPPELAARCLEALLESLPGAMEEPRPVGYEIGQLLDRLADSPDVDKVRIAQLEWALLPAIGHERAPRLLHEELGESPELFAEVVSWTFRGEGDAPRERSDLDLARARLGSELLHSWRTIPCDEGNGVVDAARLMRWVTRARELLETSGRTAIGDDQIGQLLSGSPPGPDGAWPHPAVREVIELVASDDLEAGLEVGRFNSRGVVSRGLFEGGSSERQLADGYETAASVVADSSPRTAAMLRRMASEYRSHAAREDREAELRQDLGTLAI